MRVMKYYNFSFLVDNTILQSKFNSNKIKRLYHLFSTIQNRVDLSFLNGNIDVLPAQQ